MEMFQQALLGMKASYLSTGYRIAAYLAPVTAWPLLASLLHVHTLIEQGPAAA
jgi:hypothetical protein